MCHYHKIINNDNLDILFVMNVRLVVEVAFNVRKNL